MLQTKNLTMDRFPYPFFKILNYLYGIITENQAIKL